jgi:hypothetical protein
MNRLAQASASGASPARARRRHGGRSGGQIAQRGDIGRVAHEANSPAAPASAPGGKTAARAGNSAAVARTRVGRGRGVAHRARPPSSPDDVDGAHGGDCHLKQRWATVPLRAWLPAPFVVARFSAFFEPR